MDGLCGAMCLSLALLSFPSSSAARGDVKHRAQLVLRVVPSSFVSALPAGYNQRVGEAGSRRRRPIVALQVRFARPAPYRRGELKPESTAPATGHLSTWQQVRLRQLPVDLSLVQRAAILRRGSEAEGRVAK